MITSFEYRLHEVGPVLGGGVAWPLKKATSLLRFYEDLARAGLDELSLNAGLFSISRGSAPWTWASVS